MPALSDLQLALLLEAVIVINLFSTVVVVDQLLALS